ncbi:Glycosyltransferase involved in cell wall bisynthesis [Halogranum rubrum]|uniref:Glycosyltransferase involved in cell wall bisynthesis n=1 Tax=Halogranum rubrum TaxID=553466 RepID=A0A1I4BAW3_9EURY|nr:glycosyltransferase family 2 protein [Halogranum rubrum]SFK65159.1 Glycosyltransferase involved in cell wall bisynthesis [Halogranum rubrum]
MGSNSTDTHTSDSLLVPEQSSRSPTLSVVLPTLNEAQGIATCITKVKRAIATLGVQAEIIVSDSSSDSTPRIATEMDAIVVTPDKPGYGSACRYGFERSRGDYLVMGDADTTYDFEEIPPLVDCVMSDNADIVLGSRFDGTILPGAMPPLHRYLGNPLLTKLLTCCYDLEVSDAHSGLRVLSRDAYQTLQLDSNGMEFASEMLMAAQAEGLRIEELPITYHERVGEATLESFSDGWRHLKYIVSNRSEYQ